MRPIWTGAVNFGPVSVPVRLYKATGEEGGVTFRQLCPDCDQPIKQLKTCPTSGQPIAGDLHKGFEVSKDRFELFDEIELQELHVESLHTIALEDFVKPAEIPSELYVREAYYLEPTEVGARAYLLLREALRRTGAVGLGKIAIRNRERLVTVRATEQPVLLLNTLSWPEEIRNPQDLKVPEAPVEERHVQSAVLLVDAMQNGFDPSKFKDLFATAVKARVQERLSGGPQPAPKVGVVKGADTMFAELEAAVNASKKRGTSGGVPLTPARVKRLAKEAERGYDPKKLKSRKPKPRKGKAA